MIGVDQLKGHTEKDRFRRVYSNSTMYEEIQLDYIHVFLHSLMLSGRLNWKDWKEGLGVLR